MRRTIDSLASICFFLVALPVAFICTVQVLCRDLWRSLWNIWH